MQFGDVKQVIEVSGSVSAERKMADGWKLLAVVPGLEPSLPGTPLISKVIYVLGKPAEPEKGHFDDKGEFVSEYDPYAQNP
jgi:hypothetical protein